MSAIYKRGPADVQANLTPMIDVTFLLIVFFVLVSQIVEVEHVDMQLPQPPDAPTASQGDEQRVVINIVPGEGDAIAGYRVGTRQFAASDRGVSQLQQRLTTLYAANESLQINLRADRETQYRWIDPVMNAITNAAQQAGRSDVPAKVNLVVLREE